MNWIKMLKSFKYALAGIWSLVKNENNAQFHFLATVLVISAGFYLKININEWLIIVFSIALVWSGEAFNSAIEKICDKISPEKDPIIKTIKDMSAAGVLFLAIASAVAGGIVFIPKLFKI
ncbi:diacylglycerol kinase family protein [Lacihabitans sp. LS3-19]|uniref:diacylglycerol kinase family protein n=1 Tax=Lacihabitans sp. LS3-19 TaxID=2487335 RepID=UPI0020CFD6B7|nr:diacylglycerol kinase family protein [Lacihabitans sp. LS3-19]MCP9769017.1 diacylglycerol kinase family protein [Lacihabitans sp. LS3-19]